MILSNLADYMKQASAKIGETPQQDRNSAQCYVGVTTHEDFISAITSFIEYVLVNSRLALSFEHVETLFQLLATRALTEFESNALFTLITKENENSRSKDKRFLLEDRVRNEVFQRIFCNAGGKYLNCERLNM